MVRRVSKLKAGCDSPPPDLEEQESSVSTWNGWREGGSSSVARCGAVNTNAVRLCTKLKARKVSVAAVLRDE
ncbi:uncharacterized protein PHALS_05657 [Plasmopara halstedii]|uniref:Uncharacterized protein n=1 Tax=Plasmopara halstedii TaxID=4781 RepID=A0A0N7L7W2_PLAHL|nr:uncharacterized protein PHALS_05657 [Plasmopara halstedii]CEG48187.1 hypothetical protein PHALS_05657 [Plasmopara halstedii]|eukprot:XP_024584556.1 hypothetical protein PHALS_05657 [Plasmopara halstedii]